MIRVVVISLLLLLGCVLLSLAWLTRFSWIPVDWAAAAREDAKALYQDVAENHPGPVNLLDPAFTKRSRAGLRLALERARLVKSHAGYTAVMRGYAAIFNDAHVAVSPTVFRHVARRWPGFLTTYDNKGRQIVRARIESAKVIIGAELLSCDGRPSSKVAQHVVGDFYGRWFLSSSRRREGYRVFLDEGNPFVTRPNHCTFNVMGKVQSVALQWRSMSDAEWAKYVAPLAGIQRLPIGQIVFDDGTRWYAISDFDGRMSGHTAKALLRMINEMRRDRQQLVSAPRIVLDLRGNEGGSSDWSAQISALIWGPSALAALAVNDGVAEWRASSANISTLRHDSTEIANAGGASESRKRYLSQAVAGLAQARAAGRPLWRQDTASNTLPRLNARTHSSAPTAPVYVVTDESCVSACLIAVDQWKALGAVQVGRETSADTMYMELRQDVLPSRQMIASVPMKVYRGRKRGSNVPQVPHFVFPGDMRNTKELKSWIVSLPKRARVRLH